MRAASKWISDHDRTIDAVADFIFGLDVAYRRNATWLMSSLTAATNAKIKDADGHPIWQQSLLMGQPDMLLGRPVEIDEGMPAPSAGQLTIALATSRRGTSSTTASSGIRRRTSRMSASMRRAGGWGRPRPVRAAVAARPGVTFDGERLSGTFPVRSRSLVSMSTAISTRRTPSNIP